MKLHCIYSEGKTLATRICDICGAPLCDFCGYSYKGTDFCNVCWDAFGQGYTCKTLEKEKEVGKK